MVGRTIVIGDCPWVAQCAEAFLSKLFACSYSIAGLTVFSANPSDHLVHRMTHRVARGTLLCVGRPDGRLMALTSLESSILLSINQASSIQSWGGRCESVTIGHNPFKNSLCFKNIFLKRHRPLFTCERLLDMSISRSQKKTSVGIQGCSSNTLLGKYSTLKKESEKRFLERKERRKKKLDYIADILSVSRNSQVNFDLSHHSQGNFDLSRHSQVNFDLSRHSQVNFDLPLRRQVSLKICEDQDILNISHHKIDDEGSDFMDLSYHSTHPAPAPSMDVQDLLTEIRTNQIQVDHLYNLFCEHDTNNKGGLNHEEFIRAYRLIDPSLSKNQALILFEEGNVEDSGILGFEEFKMMTMLPQIKLQAMKQVNIRDEENGLVQITPCEGPFFDQDLLQKEIPGVSKIDLAKSEILSMELYEERIASLQRFVAMVVISF
jgi:hypothetical protein